MTRRGVLCELSNGERFLVDKDEFVIGRTSKCDLCIPRSSLAKRNTAIVRRGGTWFVVDLRSTSGTRVNGIPITSPTRLIEGLRFEIGDQELHVLDLDYEAKPGELERPVARLLELSCPGLVCTGSLYLQSVTGNATLDTAIREALLASNAAIEGNALVFQDPVHLVLAIKVLYELARHRPGAIDLTVRGHGLMIGSAALELLAEDSVPARAAWDSVFRPYRPQLPRTYLRGLALDLQHGANTPPPALVAELGTTGPGIVAWVYAPTEGYLLAFDRTLTFGGADVSTGVDIMLPSGLQAYGPKLVLESSIGWVAHLEPMRRSRTAKFRDRPVAAGDRFALAGWTLLVVAIG